ncbi:MAG: RNA-guided endonuclease InsQ/TnpB family protein [Candidatus Cloacimonadia bacterium]
MKCKLIADTKTKIDSIEDIFLGYSSITSAYFRKLTKKHLGWSKRKLMILLEQDEHLRKQFPAFPSALRQSARDKAIESYKSWIKTKGKKPKMKPTVRLDKRSYRIIKTDNEKYPYFASITTKQGRVKFPLGIGEKRMEYFEHKNRNAEIVKVDGQFYINIVFDVPEKEIEKTEEVLGVDLGLTNIATVVSEKSRSTEFVSGLAYKKRLTQLKEQYRRTKKRKSKERIGKKISRLNNDVAHKVSRKIANKAVSDKANAIVFEDLKKCKPEKGKKRKKINFRLSMWMRRRIQAYTTYKAGLDGVPVVTVDPQHTSQRCPRCNHIERKNRKGILFSCKNCGYSNNADRIGSINIAQKYLGVFVGHKFPADNTLRERLVGYDGLERGESHEAYVFKHR